jgi:predicted nicotinamide N-methyase
LFRDFYDAMDIHHLNKAVQKTLPDARLVETPLPLLPELRLYLIDPDYAERPFSTEEVRAIHAATPFWIFCWASGQGLARHILRNRERFRGKRILDFGSGSGVAAIAAAMAGAAKVIACDIDPDALDAARANAALNAVRIETAASLEAVSDTLDLILVADVLYDLENLDYLRRFLTLAPEILVAESRVKNIDVPQYRKVSEMTTSTFPDIDRFDEFRRVRIYEARSDTPMPPG